MGKIKGWSKTKDRPMYIQWKQDSPGKDGLRDVVTVEKHPDGTWRRYVSAKSGDSRKDYLARDKAYRDAIRYMRRNP